MKRICITGGNGLLGSKIIAAANESHAVISIDLQDNSLSRTPNLEYIRGDITNKDLIHNQIVRSRPDVVIHAAAFTDVDGCEREKEKAWDVNVEGTRNVALACKKLGIKMIHLSTDYVFDGMSGPYDEEDEPNPVGHYGKTKLESEKVVRDLLDDFIIARTMVLYGYAPGEQTNFVIWLVEQLRNGDGVGIVDDQFGTPTLADDLARALIVLFEKDGRGFYNTAGSEWLSRYDFASRTAEVFELDASLIEKITTAELNQDANRPLRSGLRIDKIHQEFGVEFSSVTEGLRIVKQQMTEAGWN
jgi:dTDP-4-dehydrorhamnose reductase